MALLLLAEDDDDHYLLVKQIFDDVLIHLQLERVVDGEELMDYLRHRGKYQSHEIFSQPALILLDLNMPRKNGHEATREIKSDSVLKHIPIVIMSVSNDQRDVNLSYRLGANSFITKPKEFSRLVEVLQTIDAYWLQTVRLPKLATQTLGDL